MLSSEEESFNTDVARRDGVKLKACTAFNPPTSPLEPWGIKSAASAMLRAKNYLRMLGKKLIMKDLKPNVGFQNGYGITTCNTATRPLQLDTIPENQEIGNT